MDARKRRRMYDQAVATGRAMAGDSKGLAKMLEGLDDGGERSAAGVYGEGEEDEWAAEMRVAAGLDGEPGSL